MLHVSGLKAGLTEMNLSQLACNDAGVSPGTTSRGLEESPVRAGPCASPLEGSILIELPFPGLTPWAVLWRPRRAHIQDPEKAPPTLPMQQIMDVRNCDVGLNKP